MKSFAMGFTAGISMTWASQSNAFRILWLATIILSHSLFVALWYSQGFWSGMLAYYAVAGLGSLATRKVYNAEAYSRHVAERFGSFTAMLSNYLHK
jgi:hypothetical protein